MAVAPSINIHFGDIFGETASKADSISTTNNTDSTILRAKHRV